jgi:hypothetical protein|tara:strand:- start:131 stop:385 length:255 start_codon:yes stop_codon:yes gene_type:complete
VSEPVWQISYLEYLDGENPKYNLARETVQVFELLGYNNKKIIDIFNNHTTKTNFYYIISKENFAYPPEMIFPSIYSLRDLPELN